MKQRFDAVAELVTTRGRALKGFAYLLCGDDAAAEDMVQDAIVKVLSSRHGRDVVDLERYVKRALVNRSIDRFRAAATARRYVPLLATPEQPYDLAAEVTSAAAIRSAVRTLAPRQRACVVLYYYEDMPVAAIGDLLGCSTGTVKRHLSDSRAHLLSHLADQNSEERPR